ncbi:PREDICTED: probable F-box protein At1g14315 [Prunus mume]|uniref:Probable F-box protein At1g14315 n=1 Tax=Prunus mume TaxID=102107 RepID=A0ABM0PCV7_PRUMU|nr:PREDICTED: probable F-box protein At1g14315 [Prunus mume]
MVGDKVPEDIVYEILLRLPVRSLIRFTAVCKSWNCMIKSSTFITHHLIQNEDVQLLLHNPQYGMYLLYKDDDNDDGRSSSTLREYTNLENPYDLYDRGLASKFVGTSKGSWKTLNTTADLEESDIMLRPRHFFVSNLPAFVNGALHWTQARAHTGNISLLSFDMSDEVFGKIAVPPEASAQTIDHLAQGHFMVSRYRESLAYFETSRERKGSVGWGCLLHIHMRVMEEYGVAKSWAKLFAICLDLDLGVSRLTGCRKSDEVVLRVMDDDGEYRSVNPKTKQVKRLRIEGQ